jgi:hypothetical protein
VALPPPATPPALPAPTNLIAFNTTTEHDGPAANVSGWSSGLGLSLEYAPQGYGAAGWRWTAALNWTQDEARGRDVFPAVGSPYNVNLVSNLYDCHPFSRQIECGYTVVRNADVDVYKYLPNQTPLSFQYPDTFTQTSKRVETRLGAVRDVEIQSPIGRLTVGLGGELGFGWWYVDEDEAFNPNNPSHRTASGPTGLIGLTAGVGGPVWRVAPLRWSIQSGLAYEAANLSYKLSGGSSTSLPMAAAETLSDFATGRVAARLDYAIGPLGAFIAAERRRELSMASSISSVTGQARAGYNFMGTYGAAYVWPIYSSRLSMGLTYGF